MDELKNERERENNDLVFELDVVAKGKLRSS